VETHLALMVAMEEMALHLLYQALALHTLVVVRVVET
jgi:hypothetical protein